MATTKATCHVRSISLPSRSSNPLIVNVEEQLYELRSSSVPRKLSSLRSLYESVDDLLRLPLAQQALSNEENCRWVEEVLDGSLRMLDVCGATRDVFAEMKESLKELESSLRRKKGGECRLACEVQSYMLSRKKMTKAISTLLRNLKSDEKKCIAPVSHKDSNFAAVMAMLREVEETSLLVYESLLTSVSQAKARSRVGGWSIVSRFLPSKRISSSAEVDEDEVEKIDAQLLCMKSSSKGINVEVMHNILKGLEALESSFEEAEAELECVYRQLVKTKVSILNILNH